MHLVIRWWIMYLHPLLAKKLLYQGFGVSIRDFQVGLPLSAARLGKTIHLLVSGQPAVSRDPLDSDLAVVTGRQTDKQTETDRDGVR